MYINPILIIILLILIFNIVFASCLLDGPKLNLNPPAKGGTKHNAT